MNTIYWVLVFVTAFNGETYSEVLGVYRNMDICFEKREDFISNLPKDKESWESVCIKKYY